MWWLGNGSLQVVMTEAKTDGFKILTNFPVGQSGTVTIPAQQFKGDMVASVIESVNGTERVLQQMSLTNGAPLEISFAPQASANNWILIGPNINLTPLPSYTYTIETICITDQVTTQQNVLVAVCDDPGDRYRYGFNGKEKVNEWAGVGNALDFGARVYDSRVGRWLSVDPLVDQFPNQSSYLFSNGNPVFYVDGDGQRGIASIQDASGTKKDPIIITVSANYYYNNATEQQKKAMTRVSNTLQRSVKYQGDDGKYYSLSMDIKFIQSDDPQVSADKDVGENGNHYGNSMNFIDGYSDGGEDGLASDTWITIFDKGISEKYNMWHEEDNRTASYETITRDVLLEEVLHNLGGLHQDDGAVPPVHFYQAGKASITDSEKPANESRYSDKNAKAIHKRIGRPLHTDANDNPKLRDNKGTVSTVVVDQKQ